MATHGLISAKEYLKTSFDDLHPEYYLGELVQRGTPHYLHGKVQGRLCQLFLDRPPNNRLFPAPAITIPIEEGKIYRIPDLWRA